jgi:hypothetical protein
MMEDKVTPYNREHYKILTVEKGGYYRYAPKKSYDTELKAQQMCFYINMKPETIHKVVCYKCKICGKWHLGHHEGKCMNEHDKQKIRNQYEKWKIINNLVK